MFVNFSSQEEALIMLSKRLRRNMFRDEECYILMREVQERKTVLLEVVSGPP